MVNFLVELFGFVDFIWDLPILYGLSVGKMMFSFVVVSLAVWVMGLNFKDDVRSDHARAVMKREQDEGDNE